MSKDVWPGDYTRPQSLNAWMYVEGDPINATDPTGQTPEWPPIELLSVQVLRPNILESAARHNTSLTNMDAYSFAALMATILHWEGRLFGNLKDAEGQSRDRWGDYAFIATGYDASTGIANIRPSVALEILQAGYTIKGGRDYKTLLWLAALPDINTGNYLYPRGGDSCNKMFNAIFYDLQAMNISLEYLAANLQRGADRVTGKGYQASAFNLAAWHHTGVQTPPEFNVGNWNANEGVKYGNQVLEFMPAAFEALGFSFGRYMPYNAEEAQFVKVPVQVNPPPYLPIVHK